MKSTTRLMWMGVLLLVIVSWCAVPAAGEEEESSASPGLQEMLNASMERFTEKDARRLERARAQYRKILTELQTGDVDEQRMEELTAEGRKVWPILRRLKNKKRRWEKRALAPEDRPTVPSLTAAPREEREAFDTRALAKVILKVVDLRNSEKQTAEEWEALAREFQPFLAGHWESGALEHFTRAALNQGQCWLRASVLHFEAGREDRHREDYIRGVRMVDVVHRLCATEQPLFSLQGQYAREAHDLLADYCPWGAKLFFFMDNIGLLDGFDWRVLRPYGGDNPEKISIAGLKPGSIPANVRRDMKATRAGTIRHCGAKVLVDWDWVSDPTYTIWFVSPRVHDMKPSEMTAYASDALTLVTGGPLGIGLMIAEKALNKLLPTQVERKHVGSFAIGTAKNFTAYELKKRWKKNAGAAVKSVKPAKPSRWKKAKKNVKKGVPFVKTALQSVLSYLEEKGIELLFDAIDPANEKIIKITGKPLTYDGTPMPMIVIRASIVGYEKIPDYKYRKIWNHTRYYFFDPRTLAGMGGQFDPRRITKGLPREADYLAGHMNVHEATWRLFPNVDFTKWGTRLIVTSTAPQSQRLSLTLPRGVWQRWTDALPEGKTLAAVLHQPDPEKRTIIREFKVRDGEELGPQAGTHDRVAATFRLFNKYAPKSECPGWGEAMQGATGTWAARNRLNYEFIELVTEYHIDVVVCDREGGSSLGHTLPTYNYDPLTHEKKGSTVMRVAPYHEKKVTGDLDQTPSGEVTFVQRFRPFARAHDVSPEAGDAPILPPRLALAPEVLWENRKMIVDDPSPHIVKTDISGYGAKSLTMAFTLAPVPKGWHHILIHEEPRDKVETSTFHAWDYNDHLHGGCVFQAEVPVRPGRTKFTVECVTLKDVPPLVVPVFREEPEYDQPDWQSNQKRIREDIEYVAEAKTARDRARARYELLRSKQTHIYDLADVERWHAARNALRRLFNEEWLTAREQRLLDKDKIRSLTRYASQQYARVAYHLGYAGGYAEASGRVLPIQWQELKAKVAAGYRDNDNCHRFADDVAVTIKRLIALGGKKETIGAFIEFYRKVRRKAGLWSPRYDPHEFKYGQERQK